MKTHPHAEAAYEIVPLDAGGFSVRVFDPGQQPDDGQQFRHRGCGRGLDRFAQMPSTGPIPARNDFSEIQAQGRRTRKCLMRKPNYRFERAERNRLKQAKKEEKARRQQERASPQKPEEEVQTAPSAVSDNG